MPAQPEMVSPGDFWGVQRSVDVEQETKWAWHTAFAASLVRFIPRGIPNSRDEVGIDHKQRGRSGEETI